MKEPKLKNLKIDKKMTQEIRDEMKKCKKIKITINVEERVLDGSSEEPSLLKSILKYFVVK